MPGRRQVRLGRCVMAPLAQFRLRSRLAGAARQYIAADWPVASGAWWDAAEQRYRCDQAECVTQGLHPYPAGRGQHPAAVPGERRRGRHA